MPLININVNHKVGEEQKEKISKKTTDLMEQILKKNPDVTVVRINDTDINSWSVNSEILTENTTCFYVDVKITLGTNNEKEKSSFIKEMNNFLRILFPNSVEASYIIIDEIAADSWGYNGISQKVRFQ